MVLKSTEKILDWMSARSTDSANLAKKSRKEIALVCARLKFLEKALTLILEVRPTRNSHKDYVGAVRDIAETAMKETKESCRERTG